MPGVACVAHKHTSTQTVVTLLCRLRCVCLGVCRYAGPPPSNTTSFHLDTSHVPHDEFVDYRELTGLQTVSEGGAAVACESALKDTINKIMVSGVAWAGLS